MTDPYKRIARIYDTIVEPFNSSLRSYVLKVARPEVGLKVLEVGCGTGTNLELFADSGCRVSGIDLSPAMMDIARRKLGDRADLRLGDAADMPFGDDSFDLVLSFLTLHEMRPAVRSPVMQEITRVAGREGRVLFIDYHPGPIDFPKGWLYKSIIYAIEFLAGWEHFQNHRDFLTRNGLDVLIDDHGLAVTKSRIISGGNIQVALAVQSRKDSSFQGSPQRSRFQTHFMPTEGLTTWPQTACGSTGMPLEFSQLSLAGSKGLGSVVAVI